jgi:hypothetical protein
MRGLSDSYLSGMPSTPNRSLQRTRTSLAPAAVIGAAKQFFVRRSSLYPVFLEQEGPTYVTFRGQGGEEVVIGVAPDTGATTVTGSTYMFDQQVARFFTTLPPPAAGPSAAEGVI